MMRSTFMRGNITAIAAALVAIMFFTSAEASATILTFGGGPCVDPTFNNNGICDISGETIDQSHGDIPGDLDVVYDGGAGGSLNYWTAGYSGLSGVAYGQPGATSVEFRLIPEPGKKVTLDRFDIGSNTTGFSVQANVSVIDVGSGDTVFSDITDHISVFSAAHSFTGLNLSSMDGLRIRFDSLNTFAGIDNIEFTVMVPEPSTLLLMGVGLLTIVFLRRIR